MRIVRTRNNGRSISVFLPLVAGLTALLTVTACRSTPVDERLPLRIPPSSSIYDYRDNPIGGEEPAWAYVPVGEAAVDGMVEPLPAEAPAPPPRRAAAAADEPEADMIFPEKPLPDLPIESLHISRPVDLGAFLGAMGQLAGQNIFYSDKLTGTVQLQLSSPTSWDALFRAVLRAHGLTYEWQGNILSVLSQDDLNHGLALERLLEQQQVVANSRLQVEPLQLSTIRIRYAAAETVRGQLERLLTPSPDTRSARGSVTVDPGNNSVIINAIERDIRKMQALIARLDRAVSQVLIEAHIVEANRETARELGMQWGGAYAGFRNGYQYGVNAGGNPAGFLSDFPAALVGGSGFTLGGVIERITGSQMLKVQLSALEQQGRLNILSSPSITTLDNQLAYIESGKEVPYRVVSGSGDIRDLTTEWKRALLRLEVTPSVIDENLVKLKITTSKDELDESVTTDGLPRVITKRAETTLILRNGQTTVIGGLSRQYERSARAGIPVLNRIPFLGAAFRSTDHGTSMEDLLIFITPQLLSGHDATFVEDLGE